MNDTDLPGREALASLSARIKAWQSEFNLNDTQASDLCNSLFDVVRCHKGTLHPARWDYLRAWFQVQSENMRGRRCYVARARVGNTWNPPRKGRR